MFSKESKVSASKKMPDYAYIRKELLRNGVTKKLLWTEYIEDCRANGEEPLMYSQFCYHIQQDEQKYRATMHVNRKSGEQIEVGWAGDPATIIDPDTGEILKSYICLYASATGSGSYYMNIMNPRTFPSAKTVRHAENLPANVFYLFRQTLFLYNMCSQDTFHSLIYSVSSFTTSSKSVISLLPLTCHIPVMPGLIASLAL